MPLGIHSECRKRIEKILSTGLSTIQVKNVFSIERASTAILFMADSALPQTGRLRERMLDYIDEFPLTEFINETLGQEIHELNRYASDNVCFLTELDEYKDAEKTTCRLLDDFESLPWSYTVTIPLPESFNSVMFNNEKPVTLAKGVRLIRPDDDFSKEFPLDHSSKLRRARMHGGFGFSLLFPKDEPAKWVYETVYLQVAVEGFIGQYGTTATAHKVDRILRAFCGLSIAARLMKYEYTYSFTPPRTGALVHRWMSDGTWQPVAHYHLNDAVARGLAGLRFDDADGQLNTEGMRIGWAYHCLKDIASVFTSDNRADQVTLAAQWFFDSFGGQDHLLAFVQPMVVLEILLGNKSISDEIGVSELISNRFAYLIGETHEERESILADFKKIYAVRSQIVHSGKHKLNLAEFQLFSKLRWMCRRVLHKEAELLKAASEAQQKQKEEKQKQIPQADSTFDL